MVTAGDDADATAPRGRATVGDLGERRIIELLTRAAGTGTGSASDAGPDDLVIGSGDDAAVIDLGGPTVISVDTAVEHRHFRLDWTDARDAGSRAVVQSAADIAAMGGRTTGVVVSIGCPPDTAVDELLDLNDGVVAAAHRLGARVLGGDLVQSREIVVSVTSVGALDGRTPVALTGARPGDVLAVSGPLGACAAGLAVLADPDWSAVYRARPPGATAPGAAVSRDPLGEVVAAYRLPDPDLSQGVRAAVAGAHAMTDISDGLIEELVTMAAASGVRLSVDGARVPRTPAVIEAARILSADATTWALTGGEDHELLAAFAPGDVPSGWVTIGTVLGGPPDGEVLIDGHDTAGLAGWQSFGPGGSKDSDDTDDDPHTVPAGGGD